MLLHQAGLDILNMPKLAEFDEKKVIETGRISNWKSNSYINVWININIYHQNQGKKIPSEIVIPLIYPKNAVETELYFAEPWDRPLPVPSEPHAMQLKERHQ